MYLAGDFAGAAQIQPTRKLFQATPAALAEAPAPVNIKAAPVANQSAAASTAVILVMNLYGTNLIPFGLAQRAVLITALGNTTLTAANMEWLSVSEFLPNNTTPSPAPSRRHLLTIRKLGEPALLHIYAVLLTDWKCSTSVYLRWSAADLNMRASIFSLVQAKYYRFLQSLLVH